MVELDPDRAARLEAVRDYHRRTKHHGPGRYAPSLGYLDWDAQPDPFRRFDGAPQTLLGGHAGPRSADATDPIVPGVRWPTILRPGGAPLAELNAELIGRLFAHSFALSAWKEHGKSRWSLRVNPSSGNLHPTEAYLIAGADAGLEDHAALYHYRPLEHALERRYTLPPALWQHLRGDLSGPLLFVGLTSILWREAWKYGERSFRYCNHDIGHAIAALTLAAACEGWGLTLLDKVATTTLARLFAVDDQRGDEAEHPECILVLRPLVRGPGPADADTAASTWELPESLADPIAALPRTGTPNRLSPEHHPWPILTTIAAATARLPSDLLGVTSVATPSPTATAQAPTIADDTSESDESDDDVDNDDTVDTVDARAIIRQRRSAVAMDGRSGMTRDAFFETLRRLIPASAPIAHAPLPWRPRIDLALLVHRVVDVDPGLYILVRDPARIEALRDAFDDECSWATPPGCPPDLPLYQLKIADARRAAVYIACTQEIAGAGCFAAAMLADFENALTEDGPPAYRRLYWECGALGQLLYLEAEAMGIRGTGIGCFFDDRTHEMLGLNAEQTRTQCLYWFTVGGPLEDDRLRTLAPYEHLEPR